MFEFSKNKINKVKTKPCYHCGNKVKLEYPQYYDESADAEICKPCYEKKNGKVVEPYYI